MSEENPAVKKSKSVAVIVAHPDDETLWSGGTILFHPQWKWTVVSLCRAKDTDRAPKFFKALQLYGAQGIMGDLDDGPEQTPLPDEEVENQLLALLPVQHYDLIITHHPNGEYTRHLRHEEVSRAVIRLWQQHKIEMDELWVFAYEDGLKSYFPEPIPEATIYHVLDKDIWQRKYEVMTNTYGFTVDSWEATTTPLAESFWCFSNPEEALQWLHSLPSEL
ncbi:PIG-L deacetylase family protein [Chitinophaga arvensicola]|uniref:N-acetylglucosaminyl deacetylase, LmbE family n=1 Tax=Chitinophaga arvensicola TaxID=29529 RepID=A0A1I0RNW4_9BACT|nr:PIG-L family deacetylase [Chitinophaga arvensicola]SEW42275.1 N-acetylglucosaminyl deacetylase, LmbE family [Chitinophaga arvensicola]